MGRAQLSRMRTSEDAPERAVSSSNRRPQASHSGRPRTANKRRPQPVNQFHVQRGSAEEIDAEALWKISKEVEPRETGS